MWHGRRAQWRGWWLVWSVTLLALLYGEEGRKSIETSSLFWLQVIYFPHLLISNLCQWGSPSLLSPYTSESTLHFWQFCVVIVWVPSFMWDWTVLEMAVLIPPTFPHAPLRAVQCHYYYSTRAFGVHVYWRSFACVCCFCWWLWICSPPEKTTTPLPTPPLPPVLPVSHMPLAVRNQKIVKSGRVAEEAVGSMLSHP